MTRRARFAIASGAIALSLAAPLIASAQPRSLIAGTVVDFHGKYGLVIRDPRGALAEVTLHQGTIIKPVGLRLERGMKVIVIGQAAKETFAAGEIDAPLEQLPPARLPIARTRTDSLDGNGVALGPNRDARRDRWSEGPDQYSLPAVRDPVTPH
jgi:hypothetical protein